MKKILLIGTFLFTFGLSAFSQTGVVSRDEDENQVIVSNAYLKFNSGRKAFAHRIAIGLDFALDKNNNEEYYILCLSPETFDFSFSLDKGSIAYITTFDNYRIKVRQLLDINQLRPELVERTSIGKGTFNFYSVTPRYRIEKVNLLQLMNGGIKSIVLTTTRGYIYFRFKKDALGSILNTAYADIQNNTNFENGF